MVANDQSPDPLDVETCEPAEVSPAYMIVLDQREETLRFPQFNYDRSFYVRARPTLLEEDRVAQEALSLRWEQAAPAGGNRSQRRAQGQRGKQTPGTDEPLLMQAAISPNRAFVAKCVAQVTDFRLPILERGATQPTVRTFNERREGDNESNREIYEYLLQRGATPFRQLIEQFLDFVAGRETDAQADFEAFLAAHPQLLDAS